MVLLGEVNTMQELTVSYCMKKTAFDEISNKVTLHRHI